MPNVRFTDHTEKRERILVCPTQQSRSIVYDYSLTSPPPDDACGVSSIIVVSRSIGCQIDDGERSEELKIPVTMARLLGLMTEFVL